MKKGFLIVLALTMILLLSSACAAGSAGNTPSTRPSSGTGSPSATPPYLQEVSGVVKEVKQDLVLITLKNNGGDFMLRFSENSKWDEGVNKEILVGNTLECLVKLEPTFTTPSQGEVYEVISNQAVKK